MYTKDGIRSNETKQQGRWSDELYRIHSRQTFADAPPVYEIVLQPGFAAPANFKTRNVNGVLVSVNKFRHSQLILSIGDEEAPQDLMDNQPPAQALAVGDKVSVAWVRIVENDDTEQLTINYENLPARVANGQIKEIKANSEQWYDGEVVQSGGVAGWRNIEFDDDDGTIATINLVDPPQQVDQTETPATIQECQESRNPTF